MALRGVHVVRVIDGNTTSLMRFEFSTGLKVRMLEVHIRNVTRQRGVHQSHDPVADFVIVSVSPTFSPFCDA